MLDKIQGLPEDRQKMVRLLGLSTQGPTHTAPGSVIEPLLIVGVIIWLFFGLLA